MGKYRHIRHEIHQSQAVYANLAQLVEQGINLLLAVGAGPLLSQERLVFLHVVADAHQPAACYSTP